MRDKWKKRRWLLKIHVGVDVAFKKTVALKITDKRSHDAQHLSAIVEQASGDRKVVKALTDTAYDSKSNFSYLYNTISYRHYGKGTATEGIIV